MADKSLSFASSSEVNTFILSQVQRPYRTTAEGFRLPPHRRSNSTMQRLRTLGMPFSTFLNMFMNPYAYDGSTIQSIKTVTQTMKSGF